MWILRQGGRTLGTVTALLVLIALVAAAAFAATPNKVEFVKNIDETPADSIDSDPNPGGNPNTNFDFAAADGLLYFVADNGTTGDELWISDGTSQGTNILRDINPTADVGSNPQWLTAVGGLVYFSADDGSGEELWKSDGTPAGTTPVADINSNGGSEPRWLTSFGGTLYFVATDGGASIGRELWRLASGAPQLVVNAAPGPASGDPTQLTVSGDTLFFSASDYTNGDGSGEHGYELWKSNQQGAEMVKDIETSPTTLAGSFPEQLAPAGGNVYFRAIKNGTVELWVSDGTEDGTRKVTAAPGEPALGGGQTHLAAVGETLFFQGFDPVNGRELWKSNGTTARLVKNIRENPGQSIPTNLANVGAKLFFSADDGTTGTELWSSDGTEDGTVRVNINPSGSSAPSNIFDMDGTAYFTADDGTNGRELWRSDGTEAGTVPIGDINRSGGSNPGYLTKVGDELFFGADDGTKGFELWKAFDTNPPSNPTPDPNPGTPGGGTSAVGGSATTTPATPLPTLKSVKLRGRAGKLAKKGTTVSSTCDLACNVKLTVFVETKRRGKTKRTAVTEVTSKMLEANKSTDVALKWTNAGYRALKKAARGKRSAKLVIEATASPSTGTAASGNPKQTVTIKLS